MALIVDELNDLDSQMFNNFMAYGQLVSDSWEAFGGNPGQLTIVRSHIMPAAQQHLDAAANLWPRGARADEYPDAIRGCYDPEVIERAFSDTIESIIGDLENYQTEAEDWQQEHDYLVAILSENQEPHSVFPPFQGGGGMMSQRFGSPEGPPQFFQM